MIGFFILPSFHRRSHKSACLVHVHTVPLFVSFLLTVLVCVFVFCDATSLLTFDSRFRTAISRFARFLRGGFCFLQNSKDRGNILTRFGFQVDVSLSLSLSLSPSHDEREDRRRGGGGEFPAGRGGGWLGGCFASQSVRCGAGRGGAGWCGPDRSLCSF